MNPASRGFRNAFRNTVRTGSITLILGLSIGLSLTMLIAQKAVDKKIASVKGSIGTTVSISPAGFSPGSQANNALTASELTKVSSLGHVTAVTETLADRQSTTGTNSGFGGGFGGPGDSTSTNPTTTSLASPVTLSSKRFFAGGRNFGDTNTAFSLPVSFLGTNNPSTVDGTSIALSSGSAISGSKDTNDALISSAMATKNSLKVGSTFTAYNATLNVAGIFTSSTQGTENTVVLSLPALQRLSGQTDAITSATAIVDSLDNLSSATTAIKNTLGSSADVVSSEEQANNTVAPLNSVKTVSTFSLVGAVIAGAVIILLTMIMVVRERKHEIGVVKAIGGSNVRIISEFMVESLTLAVMGAVIGLIIGVVGGQPVTRMLVSSSTASSSSTAVAGPGGGGIAIRTGGAGGGFGGGFGRSFRNNGATRSFSNIKTQIGLGILLDGFGAAVLIAVLGSALAAGMISKIRPSTIMRAE